MDLERDGAALIESELLLQKALEGDRESLDHVIAQYRTKLYRTALRIVGNEEEAEDALQDGLLSAFRHIRNFQGRSKFSTWLTRIVINAALMTRRRKGCRQVASLDELLSRKADGSLISLRDRRPDPEETCSSREMRRLLADRFGRLKPSLRVALQLYNGHGLSVAETGEILGISTSAMKSRLLRARRQLAKGLETSLVRSHSRPESKPRAAIQGLCAV